MLRLYLHNMHTNMKWILISLIMVIPILSKGQELIASYSESNTSSYNWVYSGVSCRFGQGFIVGSKSYKLTSVKFYGYKSGSPTGSMYAYIYADSIAQNLSHFPKYIPLCTSDAKNISSLGTSAALFEFSFSGNQQITLSANTVYWVTLKSCIGTSFVSLRLGIDNTSPTASYTYCVATDGASWSINSSTDIPFYVYGVELSSAINVIIHGTSF